MDPILVDRRDGWAVITLNRPDKLNSLNAALHRDMMRILEELGADEACRAVMLTGAGRGFCAGQDLDAIGEAGGVFDVLNKRYNPMMRALRSLPKPTVCAVNGVAAGAGASIALACDIVLAARSARFVQAFVKIGLVPDCGGSWFLPRLVGEARARALAMTGEAITADKAESWGMIWRAVDDEALRAEAEKLTAHLATQPTAALGLIKRLFEGSADNDLAAQLDLERDLQVEASASPDSREGIQAFVEKRPARFTGRRA